MPACHPKSQPLRASFGRDSWGGDDTGGKVYNSICGQDGISKELEHKAYGVFPGIWTAARHLIA